VAGARDVDPRPTRRSADLGAQAAKAVTPISAPGPGRLMAGIASYPAFSLAAPRSTPDDGVHGLPAPAAVRQQGFSLIEVLIVLRSEEHTSELQSRENLVCR